MPAIRNTKTLAECLSLKKESAIEKSLLERIRIEPTPSTKLYNRLVEADPCWHKVNDFYFAYCPPELHFAKQRSYYASRSTKNSWNLSWIIYYYFLLK